MLANAGMDSALTSLKSAMFSGSVRSTSREGRPNPFQSRVLYPVLERGHLPPFELVHRSDGLRFYPALHVVRHWNRCAECIFGRVIPP